MNPSTIGAPPKSSKAASVAERQRMFYLSHGCILVKAQQIFTGHTMQDSAIFTGNALRMRSLPTTISQMHRAKLLPALWNPGFVPIPLYHPLIQITQEEITAYCEKNKIEFIDATCPDRVKNYPTSLERRVTELGLHFHNHATEINSQGANFVF